MMKFVIDGRMPGMNEYTAAQRSSPYIGAKMKKMWQGESQLAIIRQLRGQRASIPVEVHFKFYEFNRKRDLDNISGFAHKVIFDAMVQTGLIPDDGWNEISAIRDEFFLDKQNPRIEVEVIEHGRTENVRQDNN